MPQAGGWRIRRREWGGVTHKGGLLLDLDHFPTRGDAAAICPHDVGVVLLATDWLRFSKTPPPKKTRMEAGTS